MQKNVTTDKFVLRMPEALRNQIYDKAGYNYRSMNSEIVFCLERSMDCEAELVHQKQLVQLLANQLEASRNSA